MKKYYIFITGFMLSLFFLAATSQAQKSSPKSENRNIYLSADEYRSEVLKAVLPEYKLGAGKKILKNSNRDNLPDPVTGIVVPGFKTDYTTFEIKYNGLWQLQEGSWYTYDDQTGNLMDIIWKIMFKSKDWGNSSWVHYTYDPSINEISMLEWYAWNEGKGWELDGKQTFQYDNNGNLVESVFESYFGDDFYRSKSEYSYTAYNDEWLLTERRGFFWEKLTSQYVNTSWNVYEYLAGLLVEQTYKLWSGGDWENTDRSVLEYDGNDNVVDTYEYIWNNLSWQYNWWLHFGYVSKQKEGWYTDYIEEFERHENTWNPSNKTEFAYNADWLITEELHSLYSTKGWEYYTGYFNDYYLTATPPYLEQNFRVWDGTAKSIQAWRDSSRTTVYLLTPVSVNDNLITVDKYNFSNYPNPFNPATAIEFTLPKQEMVTISVYDINGKLVKNLLNAKEYNSGTHKILWNGKDSQEHSLSSGVYFIKIKTENYFKVNKSILLK